MKRALAAAVGLLALSAGHAVAADDASIQSASPATQPAATTPSDAAPGDAAAAKPDAWRYRQKDGLWWYWLPSERWVYWSGGRWVDYDQKSYAQFRASRPQRSYSNAPRTGRYNGNQQWGAWGPVHYDSYGNPQYPYSRRKTGIKQLGPVPAMGGVRSLPGWGGERLNQPPKCLVLLHFHSMIPGHPGRPELRSRKERRIHVT